MRVPDDWFVGFHQGLAARFWHAAGESMADADARVLMSLLPRGRVLDVPCGDGRLMRRLVEHGYDVTGIDISEAALALARGLNVRRGDLRALPDDIGPFDGAVSWGNSFGYITPKDTVRSLAALRRVIKPGGTLVLESRVIAETLLPGGVGGRSEHEFGGITMTSTYRYVTAESRLETEYAFAADGSVERGSAAYFVHTTGEVVRMLNAAGFDDVDLRSDDGPYELGSPRMIAVAS